jgi:hypothetical protein
MVCSCSASKKQNLILTEDEKKLDAEKNKKNMSEKFTTGVGSNWVLIIVIIILVFFVVSGLVLILKCNK